MVARGPLLLRWLQASASLALALALAACGRPRPAAEAPTAEGRPEVVTTFVPMTLFTKAVAGDCASVSTLIPAGTSPHDFQARPSDLAALSRARVLVKNGLGMEGFLDKLLASAGNRDLVVIDSSRGVPTLDSPEWRADHDHDHHHSHGAVNPHVWLDPLRAVQQVEAIRDGLIQADPGCADGYRLNASAYIAQLQQLNREIGDRLRPYGGKTFIAFHDVAPYFAQRYNLKADFLVDVPELNPSPADLQRVARAVKQTQLKALLREPQLGSRSFNALAKDLGVTVSEFDPLETAPAEDSQDPATYLRVMRRNVSHLIEAFAGR